MYGSIRGREMQQPLITSESVHNEYEELMKGSVPCPTCRGSGRVPKDLPGIDPQSQTSTQESEQENSMLLKKIDNQVFAKIRTELKEMKVTQETFAAVSIGRTQGYLSDLLRRGEAGNMPDGKATIQNLLRIQEFLAKSKEERHRLYRECRMESKDQRRLRREYFEESSEPSYKKRRVVSAHAKATMLKFYNEISKTPDKVALQSISDVLNLDPDIISRFFEKERKKLQDGNEIENDENQNEALLESEAKIDDIDDLAADEAIEAEPSSVDYKKEPVVIFASVGDEIRGMEVGQNENANPDDAQGE